MARRDTTVMMARIRNEERWIRRNLERTFEVAKTVVLFDDGSDDGTYREVAEFMGCIPSALDPGRVRVMESGSSKLHYILSPFRPAANEMFGVSEIRDKNHLWEYVKAQVPMLRDVLCVDGDETLSLDALRHWGEAAELLERYDMVNFPFVYLWDDEQTRRVDAIYGDAGDGLPRLRFPRLFTVRRVDPYDLYEMRFAWVGHRQGRKVLGGFHCGSVPQEGFTPKATGGTFAHPVVHFGYLGAEDRQRKFEFYNSIDPGNKFEGEYKHIIGQANIHAPGPVKLVPWRDE